MKPFKKLIYILLLLNVSPLFGQSLLNNTVTIKANRQPLHDVLTIISNESNVTFSYNTKTINRDSLVTVNAVNKPLSEVLRSIFNAGYEFKESGSYIIIRRKPITTSTVINKTPASLDYYFITGKVLHEESGEPLSNASVYEKQQLISSLTDADGSFTMKLKNKFPTAMLSISKEGFQDTNLVLTTRFNQKVSIALKESEVMYAFNTQPKDSNQNVLSPHVATQEDRIENKWIGRVLLSSKQKIRSLNLKRFYTTRAYQISVFPGIGTHGKLNAQVINHTSLNVLGGYSGGVDGFEIGTLFNIVKKDVRYAQVAGLFNVVGGSTKGFQVASLFNDVAQNVDGVQVSGLVNLVGEEVKGVQVATLYNHARSVKGLQIGFINHTLTQEGTSIGFINISKNKKGKNKVGFIVRFPRA